MLWRAIAALLCCLISTSAFAGWSISQAITNGQNYPSNTTACAGTTSITLTAGAVSANSLSPSCFSNPVETASSNSTWTASPATYLFSPSGSQQFSLKSIGNARDVEVTAWVKEGYTYVRYDGSNAIYFYHSSASPNTNGYLEVGIVTGLDQTAFPGGTYMPLYVNSNLVSTIGTSGTVCTCNYTVANTDGQYFTFGVSGFTIYAKYTQGGTTTQFMSFLEYRQMAFGQVAFKANQSTYGFRNIAATTLSLASLYSAYNVNQIDLRDWGVRSVGTTGSITAGQNTLTVATGDGAKFKVNDIVVIATGGEAGAGARGTLGVGGTWPSLSYADFATMNADTGQPQYTFAYTRNDGVVYAWSGSYSAYNAGTTYPLADAFPAHGGYVTSAGINYLSLQAGNIGNTPASSPTFWFNLGNGASNDAPRVVQWNSGTTYSLGSLACASTCNAGAGGIVYMSIVNSNLNNPPASSPSQWINAGAANAWVSDFTCVPGCVTTGRFYATLAVPLAMIARINSIAGDVLTLGNPTDTTYPPGGFTCPGTGVAGACATTTSANVYLDNEVPLNDLLQQPRTANLIAFTPNNLKLAFPPGTFAFAGPMQGSTHTGPVIYGAGQTQTFLISPNGSYGAGVNVEQTPGITVRDFTYSGNVNGTTSPFGYGINMQTILIPLEQSFNFEYGPSGKIMLDTTGGDVTQTFFGGDYFRTGNITVDLSDNAVIQNVTANNVFSDGVRCRQSANCQAFNITVNTNYQQQSYTQWQMEWADQSERGGCYTCTVNSAYLTSGISCDSTTLGSTFSNITMTNAGMEANACSYFNFNNINITFSANSISPLWTATSALLAIDTNAGPTCCGVVSTVTLASNYINALDDISPGIVISGTPNNISISGLTYTGKSYVPGGTTSGNIGLLSQGTNVTLTSSKACGTTASGQFNFNMFSPATGSIASSTADTMQVLGVNQCSSGGNTCPCP